MRRKKTSGTDLKLLVFALVIGAVLLVPACQFLSDESSSVHAIESDMYCRGEC